MSWVPVSDEVTFKPGPIGETAHAVHVGPSESPWVTGHPTEQGAHTQGQPGMFSCLTSATSTAQQSCGG